MQDLRALARWQTLSDLAHFLQAGLMGDFVICTVTPGTLNPDENFWTPKPLPLSSSLTDARYDWTINTYHELTAIKDCQTMFSAITLR